MKRQTFLVILVLLLSASFVSAADVYYVQSVKAKVMWEPSFKSKVMTEVAKGYKFIALGKEGNWIKVKRDFEQGYISALLVATHPPFPKQGLIKAGDGEIKQGVRRRASTFTSAAAARGLTQEGRKRLSREEKADYYSLDRIDSFALKSGELERFVEESRI
ncbi:MAG: hypothetical protein A2078_14545 [Nitrospirae bacterium GWC2_57_9]|nr:MAG: hypothetical protein A2078_14545 [Nitrospirae bacterium GWC2_57_9]